MEPLYVLIKVDALGRLQAGMTTTPEVPDNFVQPGDVAFVVHAVDFKARHNHEGPAQ